MPEDAGEDSAICFYTEFQNVIVSIGDRRVYESGVLADNKMTKNAVPGYHVVDIDARAGETVTIQLASAYGRYSGRIPGIYYGSRGDIVSWLIRRNGIPFVVSLMILVLTILLGVSLLFMTNENINKQKAAYGFGFIVFAAAWIFWKYDDAAADEESVCNVHGEPDFPAFDAAVIFYVSAKLRDEAALCEDL